MEVLNSQSFANVLTRCYENPRYRAAVVFAVRNSFKLFVAPVLLPGKSRGWRSLVGCSPWGR